MAQIVPYGEFGLTIYFSNQISEVTTHKIQHFIHLLERERIYGLQDWIPTYTTITLYFDPYLLSYEDLYNQIMIIYNNITTLDPVKSRLFEVPVCYEERFAPDLLFISNYHKIEVSEIIKIHSDPVYRVAMIGFMPGFPYLSGMDRRIITPRKSAPSLKIEGGSVGIAGEQTGIYPFTSPGGWNIIGKTPLKLFDASRNEPFLFRQGDQIRFKPISLDEYKQLERKLKKGTLTFF